MNEPTTIPDLLRCRAEDTPNRPGYAVLTPQGTWVTKTWAQFWQETQHMAGVFQKLGLRKGDHLAIMAPCRREWEISHFAALMNGAVVVGIDAHASAEQAAYALRDSQAVGLILQGMEEFQKYSEELFSQLKFVLCLDDRPMEGGKDHIFLWADLEHQPHNQSLIPLETPRASDPATLIYTSGTTGMPRGIIYQHQQVLADHDAILKTLPADLLKGTAVCWLPLSNIFQRMANLITISTGSTIYFVPNPMDVMKHIQTIGPFIFFGVPRFYEKLHAGIQEKLASQPRSQKQIVQTALTIGNRWARSHRQGTTPGWGLSLAHAVADRLVLKKIRGVLGPNIQLMFTGSAPMPVWLLEFFHSIGILVLEGYGVSENIILNTLNTPVDFRFGTVGKPLPDNEIRLASDGEVLVRGPGVFSGYYHSADSSESFTEEGFYKTGDLGRFDEQGYLILTGRKSELIKTSNGRKVAPVPIETHFRQIPYVDHAVVFGHGRKCLVGLMTINGELLSREIATTVATMPDRELGPSSAYRQLLGDAIKTQNRKLPPQEQVWSWAILTENFSMQRGELTLNLKLRRQQIGAHYQDVIEQLHKANDAMTSSPTEPILIWQSNQNE